MTLHAWAEPVIASPPTAVLLVDDHAVVREGYRRLLAMESDLRVVAECADANTAFELLQRGDPEVGVMVLDLSMPGRSGLDLLRRATLRWPRLRVLVFSMHEHPAMVAQALRAGAAGFVTKSSPPEEMVAAVRAVASGLRVLSDDIADVADEALVPPPHVGLSTREFDVLRLLIEGRGVDEIAERLRLSSKTVANYQTILRQKLGVSNAVELLRYAQLHNLV